MSLAPGSGKHQWLESVFSSEGYKVREQAVSIGRQQMRAVTAQYAVRFILSYISWSLSRG